VTWEHWALRKLEGVNLTLATLLFVALQTVLPAMPLAADSAKQPSTFSGMVWVKRGNWRVNGSSTELRLGDAVLPGALLTASGKGEQSTVILLPDGQRLLCECYDARTCSQGFRIPAIVPLPTAAVWEMFVGVRSALLSRPATADAAFPPPVGHEALAANAEIVSPVSPDGQVSIAAALRVLPSGQYALSLTRSPGASAATSWSEQTLDWVAPHGIAAVRIPGPGAYRIRVSDETQEPRIAIEVLATPPASLAEESAGLKQARETIQQWSRTHEGWALHDFLRAYLESRAKLSSE
jgi:hypothetical protein